MQLYVATATATFLLAYLINYRSHKTQKIVLVLNETCYHLHHWLTLSVILGSGFFLSFLPKRLLYVVVAATAGFILEGLLFKDFWKIRSDCEKAFTIKPLARTRYPFDS